MQLHCSLSGEISSRSSSYVGRRLQYGVRRAENGSCPPARCRVGVRCEKADLWQLLGGRGLPGGEGELRKESNSKPPSGGGAMEESVTVQEEGHGAESSSVQEGDTAVTAAGAAAAAMADGFEKEMMGLTGGFPGGETGLRRFISEVLPPRPDPRPLQQPPPQQRPRPPPPPLLMPGMTVIVKNRHNPFYMYSGIVQRVSDGRVGVLFEGGVWDKLLSFYLWELERTPTGPPMINPKSAILLQRQPPAS